MQCFSPITAWKTVDGGISFVERGGNLLSEVKIRCGQCIGCRLNTANAWAVRCVHEAQMHDVNSFITLTYDDNNLPMHGSLCYRDFQLFLKRLRKKVGPVRFYMCGEYGENFDRPHYHSLLFGVDFDDKRQANSIYSKHTIYRSATLEKLWPHGHSSIGEVNLTTAQYCASYTLKKVYGKNQSEHYSRVDPYTGEINELVPEFSKMSLKPGIGASWLMKYAPDVFNWDNCVVNGTILPVPKYYDKVLTERFGKEFGEMEFERLTKERNALEYTRERLAAKEAVCVARTNHYRERVL